MIFLEMLFIFVALVALCNQRHVIGTSAFAMALGLTLFFNCLITGADIRAELWSDMTFQVGEVAVYLPALAAFLMFYAVSGVLTTQRPSLRINEQIKDAFDRLVYLIQLHRPYLPPSLL